jgi:hypothetical protein
MLRKKVSAKERLESTKKLVDQRLTLIEISDTLGLKPKKCLYWISKQYEADVVTRYTAEYAEFKSSRRKATLKKHRDANKHKQKDYYLNVLKPRNSTPEAKKKARIKAASRRKADPERARRLDREWYARRKEHILPKKYARRKTEKAREHNRIYERQKRLADPRYKLSKSLRTRLRKALLGIKKEKTTLELLGCTREFLVSYIEGLFLEGMNWDNYGFGKDKWSLDHIIPLSHFDLSDRSQLKLAAHYSNLQPMWCSDNFRKGNRYVG